MAADIDGATNSTTGDPISDLGLWVPGTPLSTATSADWYFLPSGGTPLNGRTTAFTPVEYVFGSSIGVPLTGHFSAATLGGSVTPVPTTPVLTSTSGALAKVAALPATARVAAAPKIAAAIAPTSLTVSGTPGNDTMHLAPGLLPNTWVLTVNGKSQTIGSSVTTLNINGLAGSNTLTILGTGKGETAQVWPTETIFHSGNLTVTAMSFANTTINAGKGSTDSVVFNDNVANGLFIGSANDSSLTAANSLAVALNFSKTAAVASPGVNGSVIFDASTSSGDQHFQFVVGRRFLRRGNRRRIFLLQQGLDL